MPSFADLIQQGAGHAWLFIPSAMLLGILHGLEPGHSKTMMAAFIIAVKGTVTQAILLGLAATISHTLVVWGIALGGLYLWRDLDTEAIEPYFQLASAAIIIAIALWMMWRTYREQHPLRHRPGSHSHGSHSHGGAHHQHDDEPLDAHARAHADDIARRFDGRRDVTTWQVIGFGLTGGLIPCPAAITVLLLCLQLKQLALGAVLVLCFSIGLAITLVAVGVAAALAVKHAAKRISLFSTIAARAPYVSSGLIILVGIYVGIQGWIGLAMPGR